MRRVPDFLSATVLDSGTSGTGSFGCRVRSSWLNQAAQAKRAHEARRCGASRRVRWSLVARRNHRRVARSQSQRARLEVSAELQRFQGAVQCIQLLQTLYFALYALALACSHFRLCRVSTRVSPSPASSPRRNPAAARAMLASLAARVLSPVKPAPADPDPAPAAAAADAQGDATPTRPSLVRAASEDSALSELPEGDLDAPPAAKKARVSPAPEQEQLPTPSPSRSTASSSAAATKQRFSAAAPAGRSRTTRAGIADDEVATVDENPALGRDGKAYLTSGVYWSAALPARTTRRDEGQGAAPSSWRAVEPSKETAFPPPAFYGETLLDEDGPVAERGFRLPFDILRDFWYTDEAAGRKGKGRAKGRVVDDAHLPVREGKGGDKTTEADIARREKSKKPDPYRYISKSAFSLLPFLRQPVPLTLLRRKQTSTSVVDRTSRSSPPSARAKSPQDRARWAADRTASIGASWSASLRATFSIRAGGGLVSSIAHRTHTLQT